MAELTHSWVDTVLVDMDGVGADFDKEVLRIAEIKYPQYQPTTAPDEFYTAKRFPREAWDLIREISFQEGFIRNLPVIEGAVEGWGIILDKGFTPRICSKLLPPERAPHCRQEKIDWLEEHFVPTHGCGVIDEALFTPHKNLVPACAMIDDMPPELIHAKDATWEQLVFGKRAVRHVGEGALLLSGWLAPELPKLLAEAQRRALERSWGGHRAILLG